ncbi:MAG: hypothetical protein M1825_001813 [Sarcosagium campestre]|nr:MAG: hypothetical protein M1825_001813 [Sarcosagium campestre]
MIASNVLVSRAKVWNVSQCRLGMLQRVSYRRQHSGRRLSGPLARSCFGPQHRCLTPFDGQKRGIKTKTSIKLDNLPQGAIPLEPLPSDPEETSYPTVVQQARSNMRKFENCVLLTRVGSFYELYFEHAEKYGPLLSLKVARKWTNAGPVAMAGFPVFQIDRFLNILVQDLHLHVAISEEFPTSASEKLKAGALQFDRKVSRIITPGTLIDERFMNPYENNFLLAVCSDVAYESKSANEGEPGQTSLGTGKESIRNRTFGLAWLDMSTGDFFTEETSAASLPSAVARIGPREIILDEQLRGSTEDVIPALLKDYTDLFTYHTNVRESTTISTWDDMLENPMTESQSASFAGVELSAGDFLLDYASVQLQGLQLRLKSPVRRQTADNMLIDKYSLRALEIKETLREGTSKGSLLHTVRKTVTNSGTRLLSNWLSAPSTSLAVIKGRLDLVSYFLLESARRHEIVSLLRKSFDSQRLVQKFSFGRGDADDLIALYKTIEATQAITSELSHASGQQGSLEEGKDAKHITRASADYDTSCVSSILERLELSGTRDLAERIKAAVDEEGVNERQRINETQLVAAVQDTLDESPELPIKKPDKVSQLSNGSSSVGKIRDSDSDDVWIMRRSASPTLTALHNALDRQGQEKADLELALREKMGASSLTLRWTPGLGYICHIKGKDAKSKLPSLQDTRSVSSSKSTRSFHLSEWTELGGKSDQLKRRIRAEEQTLFAELREQVLRNLLSLRRNAAILDELDIACSFAALAEEQGLVRPIVNLGHTHKILGGRHPVVEKGLLEQGRGFTSNDCLVGGDERIWLITGPNMAGKSTFLRQNAVISIMAQVGSFVPAEYAEIGIVDRLFSRIGSADNLYQDQSTFMVEMLETAAILKEATPRSFVIMDEVGRGTTPEDGISVAYACLHHLFHINRCRTLFATHFHDLAGMCSQMKEIAFYCTDLKEDAAGNFTYIHRLTKGVNMNSHALKVARLAGETLQKTSQSLSPTFPLTTFRPARGGNPDRARYIEQPCA